MTERELVFNFKESKDKYDALKVELDNARVVRDKAEAALIEYLIAHESTASARYDGIGYAKMATPRVFASCLVENKSALKEYLKAEGRADMIREDVSAPTLSAFVDELIANGKPIPEMINYYLKQSVKLL